MQSGRAKFSKQLILRMCLWGAQALRTETQAGDYGGKVTPEKVLDPSEPWAPILKSGGVIRYPQIIWSLRGLLQRVI